jgi:hypothetical protein
MRSCRFDGMSGDGHNTFIEQYVAYNLISAPIVSPKIPLTRIDIRLQRIGKTVADVR